MENSIRSTAISAAGERLGVKTDSPTMWSWVAKTDYDYIALVLSTNVNMWKIIGGTCSCPF